MVVGLSSWWMWVEFMRRKREREGFVRFCKAVSEGGSDQVREAVG